MIILNLNCYRFFQIIIIIYASSWHNHGLYSTSSCHFCWLLTNSFSPAYSQEIEGSTNTSEMKSSRLLNSLYAASVTAFLLLVVVVISYTIGIHRNLFAASLCVAIVSLLYPLILLYLGVSFIKLTDCTLYHFELLALFWSNNNKLILIMVYKLHHLNHYIIIPEILIGHTLGMHNL